MRKVKRMGWLLSIMFFSMALSFNNVSASSIQESNTSEGYNQDVNGVKDIDLDKFFSDNNVPEEKQSILLEKVEKNELWDAYKPESLDQLPDDFYAFNYFDGSQTKYIRFDDGSFISVSVQEGGSKLVTSNDQELLGISPRGSWNHGDYIDVWDYKVSKAVGTASASYYADFEIGLPGYRVSKITNLYGANASGFGVTGTPTTEIVRQYEDATKSRSALARSYWFSQANLSFSWEYGVAGGGMETTVGTTCSLWLAVVGGQVFVDSKLPY